MMSRLLKKAANPPLVALALAALGLSAIGLRVVSVASATHFVYYDLVPQQLRGLALGSLLAAGVAWTPTRWLRRLAAPSLLLLPLLVLASGHLRLSFHRLAPLLLLPLVLALSSAVASMPEQLPARARDYLWPPAVALLALFSALAMPSVPTAVVAFGVSLAILFLVRWPWWTRILFVCGVGSLPLALWELLHDYQRGRIIAWLSPDRDILGSGYAFHQSIQAIHDGGWLGSGEAWASARPLPSALSDMPFTMVAHQHGLLGGLLLLALLGLVIGVALRLAWTTRGPFFRALGVGVAAYWLGYALLSVGGGLGLLPLNGATLPLVSFGGTGTVSAMITLGLLAHVALRRPESPVTEEKQTPSVF